MKLSFLCPRWGSESLAPSAFIEKVMDAGYDGIELGVTDPDPAVDEVVRRAKDAGLTVVTQHHDTIDRDLAVHLQKYEQRLRAAATYEPLFINSHTGRDCFTLDENRRVFELAATVAADTGVPIYHETHRGRCCHSPWRTVELIEALPEVRLVLDMSHWCNVCESLLEDQGDFLEKVLPHVAHIHARVGWAHGPQVSDPRAPEWAPAVAVHRAYWDRVIAHHQAAGAEILTIVPEFGPVPYLPVLPYTQRPVADQWAINVHMMNLLRTSNAD